MTSGIYSIFNVLNNKTYVGSAVDLKIRWTQHKARLNIGDHHNKHLQNAWNKYGSENFKFTVLEHCKKEQLLEKEQNWINWLKPEYNKRQIAESNLGIKWSEEIKEKIRSSNLGKKRSSETIVKLKNRVISNETRLKMSNSSRRRRLSIESRSKVSEALRKRIRKPETIEKIRLAAFKQWELKLTCDPIVFE